MKGRDSGMPEEAYWNSFFDADCVIKTLFGEEGCDGNIVEFGCGMGPLLFLLLDTYGVRCMLSILNLN